MTAKLVNQRDKAALVTGLGWTPLVKEAKQRAQEIRAAAVSAKATKVLVVAGHSQASVGLYVPDELVLDVPPQEGQGKSVRPTKLYSLAACFARFAGDGNAVLAYTLPNRQHAAIVVVESGVPHIDDVKGIEEAQAVANSFASGNAGFSYHLWTNDLESFGAGELVQDDALWALAGKEALLVPRPADLKLLLIVAVVMLLVLSAVFAFQKYRAAQKRKQMLAAAAASNPVPQYRAKLSQAIHSLGMAPGQAQQILDVIAGMPLRSAGWKLTRIECLLSSAKCFATWDRDGGTIEDLIKSRKAAGETMIDGGTLSETKSSLPLDIKTAGLQAVDDFSRLADIKVRSDSTYQVWGNAGIPLSVKGDYSLWPAAPGVSTSALGAGQYVMSQSLEVSVDVALASDLLRTAPKDIWWQDLTAEVNGKDVKVTLKGISYVR